MIGVGRVVLPLTVSLFAASACAGAGAQDKNHSGIERDYLAYWNAFMAASAAADPEFSALQQHAGGSQLATLRRNLAQARAAHRVTRGDVRHDIRSVEDDGGNRAWLVDCVNLDAWLYYDSRTGEQVEGQLIDKPDRLVEFTFARADRVWVVTGNEEVGAC